MRQAVWPSECSNTDKTAVLIIEFTIEIFQPLNSLWSKTLVTRRVNRSISPTICHSGGSNSPTNKELEILQTLYLELNNILDLLYYLYFGVIRTLFQWNQIVLVEEIQIQVSTTWFISNWMAYICQNGICNYIVSFLAIIFVQLVIEFSVCTIYCQVLLEFSLPITWR